MLRSLCFACFLILPGLASSQEVILQGSIGDESGERLPQGHIVILPDSVFGITNTEGMFRLKVSRGEKELVASYVGYETIKLRLLLSNDTAVHVALKQATNHLKELVISSTRDIQKDIFDDNQTSKHVLTKDEINSIPVLGGEADVIKTLQLLPGTVRGVEGSSDLLSGVVPRTKILSCSTMRRFTIRAISSAFSLSSMLISWTKWRLSMEDFLRHMVDGFHQSSTSIRVRVFLKS